MDLLAAPTHKPPLRSGSLVFPWTAVCAQRGLFALEFTLRAPGPRRPQCGRNRKRGMFVRKLGIRCLGKSAATEISHMGLLL
jgi:hypothetical protein